MIVKALLDEDFVNYKAPSMFIAFPRCSFKCERECGVRCCQNSALVSAEDIEISPEALIDRYLQNPITDAIVCGGLEPFDSFGDLLALVRGFRARGCADPVVIYTGYNPEEIADKLAVLVNYHNIIVKFGRYRPGEPPHFDEILGVNLASPNQYARKL